MSTILMYDDIVVSYLPPGYSAYAGYVDGMYANYSVIKAKFPGAHILSIAVNAADDADCLDVEPGCAWPNAEIYGWFARQQRRGLPRPCIYTSVSNIDSVVAVMTANQVQRGNYRLWSAHYGVGQHICGPATCRICGTSCDGTQFTDRAFGRSLDESVVLGNFFDDAGSGTDSVSSSPGHPTLSQGAQGSGVSLIQQRLNLWGANLAVDSKFGPVTAAAVQSFQKTHKLTADGIVGPQTWAVLLQTPPRVLEYGAPQITKLTPGHTSVRIAWTMPRQSPAPAESQVYIYRDSAVARNLVRSYPRTVTECDYLFGSLDKGASYVVHIVAAGPDGSHVKPFTYASATFRTG